MQTIYKVRLMFEWGGGCIWCGNDAALEKFDVGPIEEKISLSEATLQELDILSTWHDKALNWEYPPDPSPWSQAEFKEFEAAALAMRAKLQAELGPGFEVIYESVP
ncbi:hypothetical protein [Rheinheimera hassiensis]|uniref:hypothetical protein n=1 Tax=Rheinheimera hassiensis TaxID=1193627 RepID=UPI001F054EDB|nr:hypothetical protein [Rheinheimera hassiensis]